MSIKKIAIECGVVLALAGMFTLFAVYDSGKMVFSERFLFWGSTIGGGFLVARFARPLIVRHLPANTPAALQILAISAIVSIPIPIILFGFDTGFAHGWPIMNWALQYFMVLVITLMLVSGQFIIEKAMGAIE